MENDCKSPTFHLKITPSPTVQVDALPPTIFSLTVYNFMKIYLLLTILSFLYLILFGKKSMTFIQKFFSSFITPFAFLIILFNNTLIFIENLIYEILKNICLYILNPIIRILIYYVFVPVVQLLDYIHRHATIISTIFRFIFNIFFKIIDFIFIKIIYSFLNFVFRRIIFRSLIFLLIHIIIPFYTRIILPVSRFIMDIPAFRMLLSFIFKCYRTVFNFLSELFSTVGKICQIIIDAIAELIKETYEQFFAPFTQLIIRIFGE